MGCEEGNIIQKLLGVVHLSIIKIVDSEKERKKEFEEMYKLANVK